MKTENRDSLETLVYDNYVQMEMDVSICLIYNLKKKKNKKISKPRNKLK